MVTLRDYQLDTLKKVAEAFAQGYRRPCIASACGSGKTVLFASMAEMIQSKGRVVWFLVHRKELLDQTVATFDRFGIERKTIQVGMVGTYANHLENYPEPHTIIYDEAHFSTAKTWKKITDKFPNAYIIGLTATPVRLDTKPLGAVYDTLIEGPQAAELIKRGYLAPYKYYAPAVADLSALKRKGGDFDTVQAAEILAQNAVFGDVIEHYVRLAAGKKTICYCSTVKHSQQMAEVFRNAGFNAVHFDSDTPKKERDHIISDFRAGKITFLCNVDLISVGFDCPDCECCILLRPTCSTALYIQQSCRALRPAEGKTAIILDHVGNVHRHGLPDEHREWTLDGGLQKRKEYSPGGRLSIRTCTRCYSAYFGELERCPYCGQHTELTQQEIKNIREIELQEYREKLVEQMAVKKLDDCRNIAELQAYAKAHGYKAGWAYYQAKARGWNFARK